MPTYALIPGAGGSAWYWHRVTPLLVERGAEAIAVDLPADDDSADLTTYADIVCRANWPAWPDRSSSSASRWVRSPRRWSPSGADAALIVLVNPMVPAPGEAPGQWWEATGQPAARVDYFKRIGLDRTEFDPIEDFFHDVPEPVRQVALSQPEPPSPTHRSNSRGRWTRWPDVPTRVVQGSDDRLFPLEFQRRVVRERLGLDVDVIPGGHLMALSRPREVAERLESYRADAGL